MYASKLILLHSICFNLNSLCSEPELYSVWMIFVETELTVKVIPRYYKPNDSMYSQDVSSVTY